jgi:hypothetical protein
MIREEMEEKGEEFCSCCILVPSFPVLCFRLSTRHSHSWRAGLLLCGRFTGIHTKSQNRNAKQSVFDGVSGHFEMERHE